MVNFLYFLGIWWLWCYLFVYASVHCYFVTEFLKMIFLFNQILYFWTKIEGLWWAMNGSSGFNQNIQSITEFVRLLWRVYVDWATFSLIFGKLARWWWARCCSGLLLSFSPYSVTAFAFKFNYWDAHFNKFQREVPSIYTCPCVRKVLS